jgi:methionyl-tRNA formyltransferase
MAVPIDEDATSGSVMAKLADVGAPFFVRILAAWINGEITPQPQDHSQSTWIDRLEKEEGLIDWSMPAEELSRRCRAFAPWPGTYTFFEGKRLLVHQARTISVPASALAGTPHGTVVEAGSKIAVVTGEGLLGLDKVQLESRRVLEIHDFVRGQRRFVDSQLG